jgi:DNA modification methylase
LIEPVIIENAFLYNADCREVLAKLPDNSIDSIVTDPPYGLSFMGKRWDYDVPSQEIWEECLRVLKPGGHLLAFAGTRTQHRMAVRIEDAGFEIRDMIAWVYGCLDEATEVATEFGVMPYHKTKVGDRVLCYNPSNGEYSYQPILEIVEYEYSDTAYRLVGDFGEQVVSRNHRVIVECGGSEAFQLAETLEREARVPVLENLPALQQALHDAHAASGRAQQDMRAGMCGGDNRSEELGSKAAGNPQGAHGGLRGMWEVDMEARCLAAQGVHANVQPQMQWGAARSGMGDTCAQGAGGMVGGIGSRPRGAHDGIEQSGVEGRSNVSQPQGAVCKSTDQVRALPAGVPADGAQGWVCDGAPTTRCAIHWPCTDASRSGTPCEPQCDRQQAAKPDAVRNERRAQGIRAWSGHKTTVVRVVPFQYTGKVWCLRVPTGAFVAVRNGVAFPTGNSGFPKSMDVSKAIDKAAGAEREVIGANPNHRPLSGAQYEGVYAGGNTGAAAITAPATDAARRWQGWGTALKPALEPITVARKPLIGTVSENVLEHGTGALNIDGVRPLIVGDRRHNASNIYRDGLVGSKTAGETTQGRWPANLIHDGSDEVLALFPKSKGQQGPITGSEPSRPAKNTYGEYKERRIVTPRGDTGSAARFFYCAKASKKDRDEGLDDFATATPGEITGGRAEGSAGLNSPRAGAGRTTVAKNIHPTVKPTDLMRYLCRLVTPPGGIVLDPFMGSGSTGKAAIIEGFRFIGCEKDAEHGYFDIAVAMVKHATTIPQQKELFA